MGRETSLQTKVMNYATEKGLNLWRNNRGLFYTLDVARKVRAGLSFNGSSDLIGVAPNGKFIALEIKDKGKKPSKEQREFLALIKAHGGYGGWVDNLEDAIKLIDTWDRLSYSGNRKGEKYE